MKMEQQEWEVIPETCATPGAEGVATYGIRVTYPGGRWQWADVDVDPMVVQRLAARLNQVQPEPCHFADMVLEYIEECATVDF